MRNSLPKTKPKSHECAIVNLDDYSGPGTHWVSFQKDNNNCIYFDSFGNLRPPTELINYLGNIKIEYNYQKYQNFNTIICGHLCLKFLCKQLSINADPFVIKVA